MDTEARDLRADSSAADAASADEPFPCPHCGQMLAASCRVCVACGRPIDPSQIRRSKPEVLAANVQAQAAPGMRAPMLFSWPIFFLVIAISTLATSLALRFAGLWRTQALVAGLQVVTSAWVFFDAHQKRLGKPLNWSLGSLLVWPLVFPWYLSRRRSPKTPCPFMESEAREMTRTRLLAFLLCVLLGLVLALLINPPPR